MPSPLEAPGARLSRLWSTLSPLPGGTWIFSKLLGWMVPYTGSIHPHIRVLEPGHALVELKDRRAHRNHLRSIHAVALVNLAEVTSGLAMLVGLPPQVRGIVVSLSIQYLKKARGTLVGECQATIPSVNAPVEHDVRASIRDAGGDVVAEATVRWRLAPA